MRVAAAVLGAVPAAVGHGMMTVPASRAVPDGPTGSCSGTHPGVPGNDGTCLWYSEGCVPGCDACNGDGLMSAPPCDNPMNATLPHKYRTFADPGAGMGGHTPWFAPGYAPVTHPCGRAGGNFTTTHNTTPGNPNPAALGCAPVGYKVGDHSDDMPATPAPAPAVWAAGSQQDVAWTIYANHGGGYAYRLCPKSGPVTEECFQRTHLSFVGEQSWIQFANTDETNRTAIPAVRVTEGTWPAGSQWTRNPIPACSGSLGGAAGPASEFACRKGPQTLPDDMIPQPVPLLDAVPPTKYKKQPGLYGFGAGRCAGLPIPGCDMNLCAKEEFEYWKTQFAFNIIDKVQVPADLPAGDYLLAFRWDNEQQAKVWANCAEVTVTAP